MFAEQLTDAIRQRILSTAGKDPSFMLHEAASELGVSEGAIAAALPKDMCTLAAAGFFEETWEAMTDWEKMTLIAPTPGGIIEVKGRLPKGRYGHGFFNIGDHDHSIGGHIRPDRIRAIAFLSKPFMGMESHSVRFYDTFGRLMLAIYAGREGRTLIPAVRESFIALRRSAAQKEGHA